MDKQKIAELWRFESTDELLDLPDFLEGPTLSKEELRKQYAQEKLIEKDVYMLVPPLASAEDLTRLIDENYTLFLTRAARFVYGNVQEAEDICQQAFINAFISISQPKQVYRVPLKELSRLASEDRPQINTYERMAGAVKIKNPVGWMMIIIMNTSRNYYISRKARTARLSKFQEDQERTFAFEHPEFLALQNIANAELHLMVASLPPTSARIIALHFFLGYSFEEIAQRWQMPSSTVRSHALRALRLLKDLFTGQRTLDEVKAGKRKKCSSSHQCTS